MALQDIAPSHFTVLPDHLTFPELTAEIKWKPHFQTAAD